MHYCLRNQIYLQDQLKVLHRKGIVVDDIKTFLSSNFYSNLFISFHTFTWFLNITLRSKRQMYLSSASWEQFFVVTSVDIKIILCYFGHLLSNLKEILPDVNGNPKSSMLMEQYERMKVCLQLVQRGWVAYQFLHAKRHNDANRWAGYF